jgi:hypothetical protein
MRASLSNGDYDEKLTVRFSGFWQFLNEEGRKARKYWELLKYETISHFGGKGK